MTQKQTMEEILVSSLNAAEILITTARTAHVELFGGNGLMFNEARRGIERAREAALNRIQTSRNIETIADLQAAGRGDAFWKDVDGINAVTYSQIVPGNEKRSDGSAVEVRIGGGACTAVLMRDPVRKITVDWLPGFQDAPGGTWWHTNFQMRPLTKAEREAGLMCAAKHCCAPSTLRLRAYRGVLQENGHRKITGHRFPSICDDHARILTTILGGSWIEEEDGSGIGMFEVYDLSMGAGATQ